MVNAVQPWDLNDLDCDIVDKAGRSDHRGSNKPRLTRWRFDRFQGDCINEREIVDLEKSRVDQPLLRLPKSTCDRLTLPDHVARFTERSWQRDRTGALFL